jgi:rubrerythrin
MILQSHDAENDFMTKKKYQCEDCGYYWESDPAEYFPQKCPVCFGSRIHRSSRHKRFAKKARINERRTFSIRAS